MGGTSPIEIFYPTSNKCGCCTHEFTDEEERWQHPRYEGGNGILCATCFGNLLAFIEMEKKGQSPYDFFEYPKV